MWWNDGRTDGQMNIPSLKDAGAHLKGSVYWKYKGEERFLSKEHIYLQFDSDIHFE